MITITEKSDVNIRTLAATHGMNTVQLAKKVGVDKSYISLLLRGKRRYTPKVAHRIASVLEVKTTDLFDFEEVN